MTTPADLRAMRMLLGYTRDELGHLLAPGGRAIPGDNIRKLERSRTWFVLSDHAELLDRLLKRVNAGIERALRAPWPQFLITFPNDGAFRDYEPELATLLRYNSAHLMMIARLHAAMTADAFDDPDPPAIPEIMELVPVQYQEFLGMRGWTDNAAARIAWAADYRVNIKLRDGMPGPENVATD